MGRLIFRSIRVKKQYWNAWWVAIVLAAGAGCKIGTGASASSTLPGGSSSSSGDMGGGGDPGAPSCETPADHCLQPDDVLVSEELKSGYVSAQVGKQTAPPNSAGEATYMILADGSTRTSRVAYRSHRATPQEIAVGALVAVHDVVHDGVYIAPRSRQEAMNNAWFVARIVSTDPVPQGRVMVSGGYTVAVDALRIVDGDTGPRLSTPGAEDAQFVKPEHWFVADGPLPADGYVTAYTAFAIQAPSPATRGEGEFFFTQTGERKWSKHAWRTRPATPGDIKLGAHVVVYDAVDNGVYRGPASRLETINGSWFIAKVTDTSEAFKGVVTVSGGYRVQIASLRVPL